MLTFEDNVATLRLHLLQANATKSFGQYFDTYWISRKEKWAYCYRAGLGINTNMYVEAFHRVFKYQYLKGKYNKRVDKCLLALLKYDRDKSFDIIIKLAKGKPTHKIRVTHDRHERSLNLSFGSLSKVDEQHWTVNSETGDKVVHHIQKLDNCMDSDCRLKCYNCEICCHSYSCSCNDFLLNKTICKHIHLLHRSIARSSTTQNHTETNIDTVESENISAFVPLFTKETNKITSKKKLKV